MFDSGFSFDIRNSKCTYSVCLCAILQRMYLVTELCEGGDLNDLLQKNKHFTEEETKHIIKSLSEAMFICIKKVMHTKPKHPPKLLTSLSHMHGLDSFVSLISDNRSDDCIHIKFLCHYGESSLF